MSGWRGVTGRGGCRGEMKKLLIALFLILYLIQPLIIWGNNTLLIGIVLMVMAFLLACTNIIYAIIGTKNLRIDAKHQLSVSRTILAAKLTAIPFFGINYVSWTLMAGFLMLTPGMLLLIIFIPLGIGFTYFMLLATSSYSISLLYALRKKEIISRRQFIIHFVFQLIFVVDVIDQIVVAKLVKKRLNDTL